MSSPSFLKKKNNFQMSKMYIQTVKKQSHMKRSKPKNKTTIQITMPQHYQNNAYSF